MAIKQAGNTLPGMTVRLRESTWKLLEREAKKNGISVNAAIQSRLDRTVLSEIEELRLEQISSQTARKFADALIDYVTGLSKDFQEEIIKLHRHADADRLVSHHQELRLDALQKQLDALQEQLKGLGSNG
jgi:hypothetical protein